MYVNWYGVTIELMSDGSLMMLQDSGMLKYKELPAVSAELLVKRINELFGEWM